MSIENKQTARRTPQYTLWNCINNTLAPMFEDLSEILRENEHELFIDMFIEDEFEPALKKIVETVVKERLGYMKTELDKARKVIDDKTNYIKHLQTIKTG